ncbi:hypothetical protein [Haloferula rosea]|uniref:Uncharacterized protein n=1 Tax=Haloferula rosea TaxID=490093 RepID=A0A934RA42_9BACT|nr:hypothetical protein [Haloferula rosea]MBK1827954.1 hypothetical protein [Haloferula rosea]
MQSNHGAEGWWVQSDHVRAHVTAVGGMLAPAEFKLGDRVVSPYSVSPWQPDEFGDDVPALLRFLRGDFFCLPFGPQDDGAPHGDPANARWTGDVGASGALELSIDCGDSGATVSKVISGGEGHPALYYEFRISGLEGEWSYGNHPILDCSGLAEGQARVSVSPFRWGSVYQGVFSNPEAGERQALVNGATFDTLDSVPMLDGGTTDLTRWPDRRGFEDLVMMVNEPTTEERPFAWSAVVMDGYVWFSLKNPEDFPATLFWMSNGGRDEAPWNARHIGRLGIEEVCSHFCDNVTRSREKALPGITTVRKFKADKTTTLKIVQAVAEVPNGFGKVESIVPAGPKRVLITDDHGLSVEADVDWNYVI